MRRWAFILVTIPLLLLQNLAVVAVSAPIAAKSAQSLPFGEPVTVAVDPDPVAELVWAADRVVRGRVSQVESFWSEDGSMIESEATIMVEYHLAGGPADSLIVRTPGGYLPQEELGMVSAHAATFAPGEEVLLFLRAGEAGWQTADGAAGKFLVQGDVLINPDLALIQPVATLLPAIGALLQQRGVESPLPPFWRQWESQWAAQPAEIRPGGSRKWATPHATAAFYVNINTDQVGDENGNRTDFREAIIAAASSWSQLAGVDFTLTYAGDTAATQTGYNGVNEVIFMPKGRTERAAAAQAWYRADQTIVEADIWINDDYAWNATGAPAANEVDLQSALLHEFGHWLILGHFPENEAVMFARLSGGVLKRQLQPPDVAGISAIYPR